MRISKIASTSMVMALAAAFIVTSSAWAAPIDDYDLNFDIGNYFHFDWDDTENEFTPEPTDDGGGSGSSGSYTQTWDDAPGSYFRDKQPIQGEVMYRPSGNVFDYDPWDLGSLDSLGFNPDDESYEWFGVFEFGVTSPQDILDADDGFDAFAADYGGLPAIWDSNWVVDLANHPEDNSATGANMVSNWQFDLGWEADNIDGLFNEWRSADSDTWAYLDLWTDDSDLPADDRARGYLLLASNNDTLMPLGGNATLTNGYTHPDDWDSPDSGTTHHLGVTGVSGSATTSVVPEPASMTLLGIGLAGFATRRVMSRKKKA